MTVGMDAVGRHAVAEMLTGGNDPVYYEPVSRILAGGFSNTRPAQVATLIVDPVMWDDETIITWDDGTPILFG